MNEITKKPNKSVIRLARFFLPKFIDRKHEFIANTEAIKDLQPPYLILANHVNNWDPIFVNRYVKHPIQFVTSDNFFRARWLRFILREWAGAIPKTKSMSDSKAVKNILRVKNWDGVIGIFPEGGRSWDGDSLPPIYSTSKLVKLLKIPVVFVLLKGCHLACPRWAMKSRKGKIFLDFNVILSKEDIESKSVDEIHRIIEENLKYSEYEWQRENMYEYDVHNRAERLELMLFTCPQCLQLETLVSRGNDFYCTECNYKTTFTKTGFFETESDTLYFDNPRDWNKWQIQKLHEDLDQISDPEKVIFDDSDVVLFKGKKIGVPKKIALGRMVLKPDRLLFINERRQTTEFLIKDMVGCNIQSNRIFEFYIGEDYHRFIFRKNQYSVYKWELAVHYLK
jgi:1-acyl-sn-glycerol-3-phosphate acyltransferase